MLHARTVLSNQIPFDKPFSGGSRIFSDGGANPRGRPLTFCYCPRRSYGKVIFSQACVKNSVRGGVCLSACWDTPPPWADNPQADTPWVDTHPWADTPHIADGYCSGWYPSYWNAFFFGTIFTENRMKMRKKMDWEEKGVHPSRHPTPNIYHCNYLQTEIGHFYNTCNNVYFVCTNTRHEGASCSIFDPYNGSVVNYLSISIIKHWRGKREHIPGKPEAEKQIYSQLSWTAA